MTLNRWDDIYLLSGPTASGKTAVAMELAERLDAEILSIDSMAVYRGMDIGTAKPTAAERQRVPHHLIDLIAPSEQMTVARWLAAMQTVVADLRCRGKRCLFVGGAPLYLKALLRGLFPAPPPDLDLRARLETLSTDDLRLRLRNVDATAEARIQDRRRLVRALEVWEQTGRTMTDWQTQFDRPRQLARPGVWLSWPRPELHERIHQRLDAMLAGGWLDECRRLRDSGVTFCREAQQAAGYAELFAVLDGTLALEAAIPLIRIRTRQLAKRQETWLRHLEEMQPVAMSTQASPSEVAETICELWLH